MHIDLDHPFISKFRSITLNGFTARMEAVQARRLVSAAVFFVPLLVYTLTAAPTIYNLDSAELTIAAATGGLMRATGYPLYLLIGRFWSHIPIGDVGFRMNLFSAVCGALAVWLVYRILRRLGAGAPAAAGAAGLLATAPFFWSLSLVAEVYTLHAVLMAVLILLLLRWADRPSATGLALVTFWIGLSMGHHLASALLVPGALVFAAFRLKRKLFAPVNLLAAFGGLLLGLSIYLYLPVLYLGDPAFNYAGRYDASLEFTPVNLASPQGLWWLVTGQSFAAQMFAYSGRALLNEAVWYAGHLGRAFIYIGIGPGLLGLLLLFRRNRALGSMLLLMFAASAFFYIDYMVVDKETMFIPTYVVWAIWAGIGYQALYDRIRPQDPPWLRPALSAAVGVVVLAAAVLTGPRVSLALDWSTREIGEEILDTVEQDAVIFGWWDSIPPLQYLQMVEGLRPDVQTVNRFLISGEDMYAFIHRAAYTRPVYIDGYPGELDAAYRVVKAGSLYRIELIPGATGHGIEYPVY